MSSHISMLKVPSSIISLLCSCFFCSSIKVCSSLQCSQNDLARIKMSIIDSYTCVNYFMSVLVANIFFSIFDCRPRPLYRPCMFMLYLLVLIYVMYLY